jgi:hypothetical protein
MRKTMQVEETTTKKKPREQSATPIAREKKGFFEDASPSFHAFMDRVDKKLREFKKQNRQRKSR